MQPLMQAGAEVIATEILLSKIKLREGMRAVHNSLDSFGTSHLAHRFHGSDLTGDVDLVRDQDQARFIGNSFFKCRSDLIEILWRNRNLNTLKFQRFRLPRLTHR